jgi:hypothetical protein
MDDREYTLRILKALMVQFVKEKTEYPREHVYLCLAAQRVGWDQPKLAFNWLDSGWEVRGVVRDLLERDGIHLDGAGFNYRGDIGEFLSRSASANERRRIWLSNKIAELS